MAAAASPSSSDVLQPSQTTHAPRVFPERAHRGLSPWLRSAEEGRPHSRTPWPHALPARLCFAVERLADAQHTLFSGVLLGWNRDGSHLLSYSRADGDYTLHVWSLGTALPAPVRPFVSVPLFAGRGARLAGPFGDDERDALLITVSESEDGELLGTSRACMCQLGVGMVGALLPPKAVFL